MFKSSILLFLLIISYLSSRKFCKIAKAYGMLDVPNSRSAHKIATPRAGGVIFAGLWICVFLAHVMFGIVSSDIAWQILPSVIVITGIGFLEDFRGVSIKARLLAQIFAATLFLYMVGGDYSLHFGKYEVYLSFLWFPCCGLLIVWSVNLFNFMDGLDAFAAIEAIFLLSIGGVFFAWGGGHELAFLCWSLVVLLVGFSILNKPIAKVFMGDVGSYFLGFLIAVLAIIGDIYYRIPISLWLISYSLFWFDATVTLMWRIATGEEWYHSHNMHAYQILHHKLGWSQNKVLLGASLVNIVLAMIAIWVMFNPGNTLFGFGLALSLLSIIYYKIHKTKQQFH